MISDDGFSRNLYVPLHRAGHEIPFIPKGCCRVKCSRVRGYCRGRHALVYRAILQDLGTIYEAAGSNSGLSDNPVFQNLFDPCGYLSRVGGKRNGRPRLQWPVELTRVRAV